MISIPCNQACYAPDVCYQEPAFSAAYVPPPVFGYQMMGLSVNAKTARFWKSPKKLFSDSPMMVNRVEQAVISPGIKLHQGHPVNL